MLFLPRHRTCPEQSQQSQANSTERALKELCKENKSVQCLSPTHKGRKKQLKFTDPLKYSNQRFVTRLSLQSSRELQLQNKLNQNRYTLNFSDSKSQSLPKLNSLYNMRQTLISEDAFYHFKKMNANNGRYAQALKQLERIEQRKKYKLKLQKRIKIKTRKNIFETKQRDNIQDIYDLFVFANTQQNKKQQTVLLKYPYLSLPQSRKQTKMLSCVDNKWKLGDFLDPIVNDQMVDTKKSENIKSRLAFLGEVKRIENACDSIQEQNKSKTYLNLFSKFSEKLDSNLYKKKRKLQKVQTVFKK